MHNRIQCLLPVLLPLDGFHPCNRYYQYSVAVLLLLLLDVVGPFLGSDRESSPVTPATRLPIAVNGRGRSHNRTFGHFQLHIDYYYNSFYFICIISFSGLHVLGLERTLHDP
jgi:hypothetical protein